jgi:hypothetical protein
MADWEITPLSSEPERVRATGAIYWQGRLANAAKDAWIRCVVGRTGSCNAYHPAS